jgi:hypothetical protein
VCVLSYGLATLHMISEGLGDMFQGGVADEKMSAHVVGVPIDCIKCAQSQGARTLIGMSENHSFSYSFRNEMYIVPETVLLKMYFLQKFSFTPQIAKYLFHLFQD